MRGLKGPVGHPAGPTRPARRRRRGHGRARGRRRPPPRVRGDPHQRRSDLPPVAGPRRRRRPWSNWRRGRRRWRRRLRLMAGNELVTEGFRPGQVGSSAMPHKMNARSCERIGGFRVDPQRSPDDGGRTGRGAVERGRRLVLGRSTRGAARCLLRRRRAVPDDARRARRVRRLSRGHRTGAAALPAVPRHDQGADGGGAIRVSAARRPTRRSRSTRSRSRWPCASRAAEVNDLVDRLAADPRLGLDRAALVAAMGDPLGFVGNAPRADPEPSSTRSRSVAARYPDAAVYDGEPIL